MTGNETPGYQAPGYAAPNYYRRPARTDGFAIASLIFGLIGGVLLGLIFGFVALRRIKRDGSSGRGLAIAGLVLSAGWASLIVLGATLAIAGSASRDVGGQITGAGDVSTRELKIGDCIATLDQGTATNILSVPAAPCASPHAGEVVALFDLPSGPFPGQQAVIQQATARCNTELNGYAPNTRTDPSVDLYGIYPQETNWRQGDRGVVCVATSTSGPTTGSIRGR